MENEARNNEELPREADVQETSEAPSPPVPSVPVWPRSAPVDVKPVVTPDGVKLAAALVIAHGALTSLSALQAGRSIGDLSGLPMALVWLGVTIVLGGALSDRQAWAWWVTTFLGGMIGIFNLLKVIAYVVFSASNLDVLEEKIRFSPLLIGIAGVVILIAVALLAFPESKAAFGIQSAPSSSGSPSPFDDYKHE